MARGIEVKIFFEKENGKFASSRGKLFEVLRI